MMSRPIALASLTALFLTGCIINVNGAGRAPSEHSHQSLQLNASGLNILIAETGAGALEIKGVVGLTHITLEADIYTYEGIDPILTLEKSGNSARLVTDFDSYSFSGNSPYIDLIVKVPADMKMDINDGSGSITIEGTSADIVLKDGSGSLEIEGGRNLDIEDGSGSITLSNVNGNIMLDDGSGSIEITRVNGDVTVNDGSGSLDIEKIQGMVTIDDGSGSIDVTDTKGLRIIAAGSGSLSFNNIDGKVNMQ
ncbi:DUF4097 domain-containing protein [Shewanella sp. D64]|uniref:hypothetical protein n=1 Tax=unclassified Shewanella TaxID=196818 RepID=UPI0022BA3E9E|nr:MULTISPECIES: hypothetical protein [unclassified Shewanella]MEC4726216.1 DUF4097 domain-containing protein [Shewanella sp. D64]MEC4738228.1 DUF4097 domain-containing protein [Shewanella sp. E94]WBJ95370.1 DUF4097 domain-containing protein [Shewanella sp. MTB7]